MEMKWKRRHNESFRSWMGLNRSKYGQSTRIVRTKPYLELLSTEIKNISKTKLVVNVIYLIFLILAFILWCYLMFNTKLIESSIVGIVMFVVSMIMREYSTYNRS